MGVLLRNCLAAQTITVRVANGLTKRVAARPRKWEYRTGKQRIFPDRLGIAGVVVGGSELSRKGPEMRCRLE
jgi:hypothetical protein